MNILYASQLRNMSLLHLLSKLLHQANFWGPDTRKVVFLVSRVIGFYSFQEGVDFPLILCWNPLI